MTLERTQDEELTAKQERFLALLDSAHTDLVKYIRVMTRDRDEMLDVLGETLLIAYERFDTLMKPPSFHFYLITIARRVFSRMKWRRRLFRRLTSEELELCWDNAPPPDAGVDADMLYGLIQKLPERQREAFMLFEISGFSLEEIRRIQGGTLSGVKSRLARARHKLALALTDLPMTPTSCSPEREVNI